MKVKLIIRRPKKKEIGIGDLNVTICSQCGSNVKPEATFSQDDRVTHILISPEIYSITSYGIFLKGFEFDKIDKKGNLNYNFQEWYCPFVEEINE